MLMFFFISLIWQSFYPSLKIHTVKHSIKMVCGICGLGCLIFTCNPHINLCQISYKFFGRYVNLNFTWCITINIASKITWSQRLYHVKNRFKLMLYTVLLLPLTSSIGKKLWFKKNNHQFTLYKNERSIVKL